MMTDTDRPDPTPTQTNPRASRRWLVPVALVCFVVLAGVYEMRTSRLQAYIGTRLAAKATFHLAPGPTDSVLYPTTGPYDIRRGYTLIPAFTDSLAKQGFVVVEQARSSPTMLKLQQFGLYPVYDEKAQAGLAIDDRSGHRIYGVIYPERLYRDFGEIPPPVVDALLYIENRELLEPGRPFKNPAVEWDRLARATFDLLAHKLLKRPEPPGGSTLATQIEKYRHSPEGRTSSARDKLLQMGTATLRAYRDGGDTEAARRNIVVEFVNSVPLAALAGYGEVNGLGDGLWAWYEAEFDDVNRSLRGLADGAPPTAGSALAFKQVLSLFIAHRRPSAYLLSNRDLLRSDTDAYVRLLARDGRISPELARLALEQRLTLRQKAPDVESHSYVERKAANAVRTRLLQLLALNRFYDLDRVDMTAATTLDADVQDDVTRTLMRLREPSFADSAQLRGDRLLARGDPAGVVYSFTLYEKSPQGNRLVVQADNYDQPLDINEGAKLDLGSTAKLRTLVNYLEIVWRLHGEYAGQRPQDLRKVPVDRQDAIRRWAIDWLATSSDTTLASMLEAAMNRSYSASTGEKFFTAGGLLSFANFNREDDGRIVTVREATRHSVNLAYIRLMRDIVRHYTAQIPGFDSDMYSRRDHPARRAYLEKFADKEGKQFLAKFLPRYRGKTPDDILDRFVDEIRPTAGRLAMIYRSVRPGATLDDFSSWARRHLPSATDRQLADAFERHPREKFDLHDRGYVARVHPLELWLVEYLYHNPEATWRQIVDASPAERQAVYKWLFNSRSLEGQNSRIRVLVEEEAFQKVHAAWKRQGYPFSSLVASYATSIGSSADRPAALADLMGILVNDGVRMPSTRITGMHLAPHTPYEIRYESRPVPGERVYPPELAKVVRDAVVDVVENGTARRVYGAFRAFDGRILAVGGKTGTGDHRYETYGKGGRLLESRVVNRTATFVFLIDDRYFGTLTAYVSGPKAAGYSFTSSLPVQILKTLAPALEPLMAAPGDTTTTAVAGADTLRGS
jgi:membrane peptidoglycan carboxypeptidase